MSQAESAKEAAEVLTCKLAGTELALEAAKKRPPSKEAAEVLHDLMNGGVLLNCTRVNQDDVFMLSPRTQR